MVHYRTAIVDGHKVFYREAGDPKAPTLLLLHGFPTSSFKRDDPKTEVHFVDSGHFPLETHVSEIATIIRKFLDRNVARQINVN